MKFSTDQSVFSGLAFLLFVVGVGGCGNAGPVEENGRLKSDTTANGMDNTVKRKYGPKKPVDLDRDWKIVKAYIAELLDPTIVSKEVETYKGHLFTLSVWKVKTRDNPNKLNPGVTPTDSFEYFLVVNGVLNRRVGAGDFGRPDWRKAVKDFADQLNAHRK
mgnify:CR=1 FL=1